MEYEIAGWDGYYLHITEDEIKVYTSWKVICEGIPRGHPRPTEKIERKRKELTQRKTRFGYITVELGGQKNKKKQFLHRLIAETLIPNPHNLECVDHIDGNKTNNNPSNLQWITRGDNVRKAQQMGQWGTPPKRYQIFYEDGTDEIIENVSKFSRERDYCASKVVAVSKGKRPFHKNIIRVVELP